MSERIPYARQHHYLVGRDKVTGKHVHVELEDIAAQLRTIEPAHPHDIASLAPLMARIEAIEQRPTPLVPVIQAPAPIGHNLSPDFTNKIVELEARLNEAYDVISRQNLRIAELQQAMKAHKHPGETKGLMRAQAVIGGQIVPIAIEIVGEAA
jgi:hypothetical protein